LDLHEDVVTYSIEDTAQLAKEFASSLKGGEVVVLNGTLGAGKTYFIKNAGLYLKVKNINSPTFSIVNEYQGVKKINHFDFYRINSVTELYNIGIDDYFSEEDSITFIEWGNLFPEILPNKRIEVSIIINEDFSREFRFKSYG
jgi:tRNA threonylcarbamoyladenosine biosynthesis protein TsaE